MSSFVKSFAELLDQQNFSKEDLVRMLSSQGEELAALFEKAAEIRGQFAGKKVYLRGLVEYSNYCGKDCYYCGIRSGNASVFRYTVTEEEVIQAAKFVQEHGYGSMVIQSGELSSPKFTDTIARLIERIHKETGNTIGITLSLGEQSEATYRKWFDSGAKRYLLRIETSNKELFEKIHPLDENHLYEKRLEAIELLKKTGYQTGTGVMIGLPFQTIPDLADDLLFFQKTDIDMVGMGPYIEHEQTPLYASRESLLPQTERLQLALKMVACLRILMKDINIAATTALQTLNPSAREQALVIGANIIMPNLTPQRYRENYFLYQNKAVTEDDAITYHQYLEQAVKAVGCEIAYHEHGDSKHFASKQSKMPR